MFWKKPFLTESWKLMLNFSTFSVGGWWGQPMLLFKNWSMKLKCPNLRNAQIPSFWPKSCFLLASEVFKVYQIRSKDPVCKAFSRVSKTEQFRENHASFDFTKYTLLQKYTQFCLSWCKMPRFRRVGMKEGGKPLPLALQYLIFLV